MKFITFLTVLCHCSTLSSAFTNIHHQSKGTFTTTTTTSLSLSGTSSHEESNTNNALNRRTAITTTAAGILALTTKTQSAYAAEKGAVPLETLISKIENGLYFGTDVEKMKRKEKLYDPNSNGAPEKHLPVVTLTKAATTAGYDMDITIPHVMTEEHFIQFIWIRDVASNQIVLAKGCSVQEGKAFLKARVPSGVTLRPYCFCNLHGLWVGEPFTVA